MRVTSFWALTAGGAIAAIALAIAVRQRQLANAVKRRWAHGVEVRRSCVRGAGDGLFAARDFACGEVLGEYYGRALSLLQAINLKDRDYLMGGFG